ncbi:unnamed protein product, partial [Gongylonema pulchrum]|uniref:SPT6_acidic domain-containing protein n=1 Tax=Gongylonema pulchrum TaxID=637853 RepID=A0A183DI67_9BILA
RVVIESDEEEEEQNKSNLYDKEDAAGDEDRRRVRRDSERIGAYDDEEGSAIESEHSEDDFIVTDDGHQARHRQRRYRSTDVPEQAMDDAREIFGVDEFNFAEFYDEDVEPGDEEDEYPEDEEHDELEGADAMRAHKIRPKEKKATLMDTIEPAELEEKLLAPLDKRIQLEDKPERFQLRRVPVTEADEHELELESKWIYQYAFDNATLSQQVQFHPNSFREC